MKLNFQSQPFTTSPPLLCFFYLQRAKVWPCSTEDLCRTIERIGFNGYAMVITVITGVENLTKHNKNKDSRRIKRLFLILLKIISKNHCSRLLWKLQFRRKKIAISHFTGDKNKAIYESRKYPLPSLFQLQISFEDSCI